MIKWTLRIILGYWLVHFGYHLLPGGKVQHDISCPDGYAYQIPEEPFKGLFVRCELFDQFYYFFYDEKDFSAAMQYVIIN